jgi:hypothetical protein
MLIKVANGEKLDSFELISENAKIIYQGLERIEIWPG